MARLNLQHIEVGNKKRYNVHGEVYSTYNSFENSGGKYFQIDTYGSNKRDMAGKISQFFQFDKETATFIVNLLIKEFELQF